MKLHAYVSGRVQGVFFRKNTKRKAQELGLTGWVKNLDDGRVEVIAEGKEEELRRLLKWLNKGPPSAQVENVQSELKKSIKKFKEFRIIY